MELLAMSRLPHYGVGGTLHLVVNNQLGFTTPEDLGRYATQREVWFAFAQLFFEVCLSFVCP